MVTTLLFYNNIFKNLIQKLSKIIIYRYEKMSANWALEKTYRNILYFIRISKTFSFESDAIFHLLSSISLGKSAQFCLQSGAFPFMCGRVCLPVCMSPSFTQVISLRK